MINDPKVKDITDIKFGRLTAREFIRIEKGHAAWLFECDCGNKKVLVANNVRKGRTKSCGCIAEEYRWVVKERAKGKKND